MAMLLQPKANGGYHYASNLPLTKVRVRVESSEYYIFVHIISFISSRFFVNRDDKRKVWEFLIEILIALFLNFTLLGLLTVFVVDHVDEVHTFDNLGKRCKAFLVEIGIPELSCVDE